MFRHAEDKRPVALFLALTVVDITLYLSLNNPWLFVGYWLLMFIPKGLIAPWTHHHQHSMTFKSPVLNRLLELFYGLHTGMTTHLWLLHHVLGHHVHFMDQTKDESRWRRKSGKKMGVVEYTISVAVTSHYRAFKVGQRYPKQQRVYLIFTAITFAIVAALVWYRPLPALFIFVLPMICTLFYTSWATYRHHAGLDSQNQFAASRNIMNQKFNFLTGNLGYHTAHHYKQGLHWSKLPELHEEILHRIPEECMVRSTFDAFLRDDPELVPVLSDPTTELESKPVPQKLRAEPIPHFQPSDPWQASLESRGLYTFQNRSSLLGEGKLKPDDDALLPSR